MANHILVYCSTYWIILGGADGSVGQNNDSEVNNEFKQ